MDDHHGHIQPTDTGVVAKTRSRLKRLTLSAVVERADGRIENLGVIAERKYTWWQRVLAWLGLEGGFAVLQVNTGRAVITALIKNLTPQPQYGGWGTGAGTTAAGDTTLFTEDSAGSPVYARIAATFTQITTTTTNDTIQAVYKIISNGTKTITNAGLLDALTSGNLWLKGDHSGIPLLLNDSITYTFQCQYT